LNRAASLAPERVRVVAASAASSGNARSARVIDVQLSQRRVTGAVPAAGDASRTGVILALAGAAIVSLGVSYWYATTRFIPAIPFQSSVDAYDAFRYDGLAHVMARWPLQRILEDRILGLLSPGYVRFLALLYSYIVPDALLGCFVNWLLWLGAGLFLMPIAAKGHPNARKVAAIFMVVWLLVPDGIDWTGTTSKEPLCALIMALSLYLASAAEKAGIMRVLLLGSGVGLLAAAGQEVRDALLLLAVLPFALALEMRFRKTRFPWTFAGTVLLITASFVGLTGDVLGMDTEHEFARTGYGSAKEIWAGGFSSDSVLLRLGSDNRWLDLLVVPVRGLAHLITPLNMPPTALPLAEVAAPSLLQWVSSAIYVTLSIAVVLRLREHLGRRRLPWPPTEILLTYTCLAAIFILGLTGIIHERYRSILVPAFLALGVRSFMDETAAHGTRRITRGVLGGAMLAAVGYMGLKFIF
jgi:hypothetical protein